MEFLLILKVYESILKLYKSIYNSSNLKLIIHLKENLENILKSFIKSIFVLLQNNLV